MESRMLTKENLERDLSFEQQQVFNDTVVVAARPALKTQKHNTIGQQERKLPSQPPKFEPVRSIMQEKETNRILQQNQNQTKSQQFYF